MIGCYDFCGHYDWTFAWLERAGGVEALHAYWRDAIGRESQQHARQLIINEGLAGMARYWGHTLEEESPTLGFSIAQSADAFRLDIHDCPSRGFLLRNGIGRYRDYCDHCIGWIGPLMKDAGFTVDHEHNHCGQCWWEMHPAGTDSPPPQKTAGNDARLLPQWAREETTIDRFSRANGPDDKKPASRS